MEKEFVWQHALPGNHGMQAERLKSQWNLLHAKNTDVYLVIRNDRIIFERYADGWNGTRRHGTASTAKAVVGGLSLMVAMDDGLICLDDLACKYIPQWSVDPVKSKITIRHLASHTSGLDDSVEKGVQHDAIVGWKGDFWRGAYAKAPDDSQDSLVQQNANPFLVARDQAPVIHAPGTVYCYSNPGIAMLAYAVTASLKGSKYEDIRSLLWERLINPMGIVQDEWKVGYNKTFETDGLKIVPTWGGGDISPYAMARIGRLMLKKGTWEGLKLLNTEIVRQAVKQAGHPFCYGLTWLTNSDLAGNKLWPSLPWDAYVARGAGMQVLLVVPSLQLIMVRYGADLEVGADMEKTYDQYLFQPLAEAFNSRQPCPWSKKITGVIWSPASSIIRLANGGETRDGSDNWPMTWADDDNLYTAYGDGHGFSPELPGKLGLGFAKVLGMPDDFRGENIRSSGENLGSGSKGEKASGLLMVNGVLYMWVRNADKKGAQSRLAYSLDYQKTWEWCDWQFSEFGHIAFVNYGKNYEGARDGFVYMISHDNPSAYKQADRFILMRAPGNQLMERINYEFFAGVAMDNTPVWSAEPESRQAILTHFGQCRRVSMSFNAGIGRYLMWQQITHEETDTRFLGGLGIYEAPEPWGPWSTVYFTDKWDVGPGDLGCFPTKWMNKDGRTIYLVFSGDDNFSVRKLTLTVGD